LPVFSKHLHLDGAVINQNSVAGIDVVDEILVIDVHRALFFALFATHGESELLARLQVEGHAEFARPDGRALSVHQHADDFFARGGGCRMSRVTAAPNRAGRETC